MPGDLVQSDTLFVNLMPAEAIKYFTAYDPVAEWAIGHVATVASASAAKDLLDKLIVSAPFKVKGIQIGGGSGSCPSSTTIAATNASSSSFCRSNGPTSLAPSASPSRAGDEFYVPYELPHQIDKLQPLVDAVAHRFNHYRPHQAVGDRTASEYLKTSAPRPPRLICPEPGHCLARGGNRS
jgi:putative transposase